MSVEHYQQAVEIIRANPEKADFVGARNDSLIRKAEERLGLRFPPDYRQFLAEYGAGNFGAAEFYGVIDENFDESSVPDGIWYTLDERRNSGLPDRYMIIGSTGDGGLYCLHIEEGARSRVVVIHPGDDPLTEELVAEDFGAFFLTEVSEQVESD